MADKSKIEWTDATWNPIRGCSRVSEGCRNCYAERTAARFAGPGQPYEGVALWHDLKADLGFQPHWTGDIRFIPELLAQPLHWRKPRKIFVNSMSDLFHEKMKDGWIDQIFAVMAMRRYHTFQILTKRPQQMLDYMKTALICGVPHPGDPSTQIKRIDDAIWMVAEHVQTRLRHSWPLPNVWLGVSVEDQKTADERIPLLLQTPAAVRWVSYEPALTKVDFGQYMSWGKELDGTRCRNDFPYGPIDWIVAGGESGPGARPCHPDWIRTARDQCRAAGVPFFFKQWGEYLPIDQIAHDEFKGKLFHGIKLRADDKSPFIRCVRVGKKRAGHVLDGEIWQQFPAVRP